MFGDIGIGILISIFASEVFNIELSNSLIFGSIIFSLLPDIDMLIFVFPSLKKIFRAHRKTSHYPILYLPLVLAVYYLFGGVWAFLLGANVLAHLIHDTFWMGWGIAWFWPFSHKSYKFFSQDHKIPEGTHWIPGFYFRPTLVSIVEYGIFIISLVALGFSL